MRELREAVEKLKNAFQSTVVLKPVEIQVDSFSTITAALNRAGIPLVSDPKTKPASFFMGVPVVENCRVPPGFAAIISDGKVECILDLCAAEQSASQEGSEPS